jgi:hypothetical protein
MTILKDRNGNPQGVIREGALETLVQMATDDVRRRERLSCPSAE